MPTFLIQTFLVVVFKAEKDKTRSIKILFISNLVLFIMPFIIKKWNMVNKEKRTI